MSEEHDGDCLQLKDIVLDLATGFSISMRTINIRTGTELITGQRIRSDRGPKIWPRERIDPCRRSCIRSGECQIGSRYIRFGNVTDCIGQGEVQKEKRAGWRKEEVVSVEVSVHVLCSDSPRGKICRLQMIQRVSSTAAGSRQDGSRYLHESQQLALVQRQMVCRCSPCLMHMLPELSTAVRRMVSCSVLIPRMGSHRLDPTISTVDGHNQPPLIIACTPRAKPAAVGHARRKRQRPRPCDAHAHHAWCCMPCAWPRGAYVWVVWSLLVLSLRHRLIGIRNASHTRCISLSLVVVAQRSGSRDDWSAASPPQEPEAPLMASAEETALHCSVRIMSCLTARLPS